MKIFKIVCTLIFAFLFCLSCSIFFKSQFQIEGDYLSAFSTLVAATVAYYFYSDWKEEHKFKLLDQYHNYLNEKSSILITNFKNAYFLFITIEGSTVENGEKKFKEGYENLSLFTEELYKVQRIIVEYRNCLSTLEPHEILKKHITELLKELLTIEIIQKEFIDLMFSYPCEISSSPKIVALLEHRREDIMKFDLFCSIDLSDFYFKYLNK